jgi:hypothetical protein
MVKAIRKYQKWILVIGGSLLMVTFLVQGTASQFTSNLETKTVARFQGKKVSARDLALAEHELQLFEMACPAIVNADMGVTGGAHWFLLCHEAQEAGLVGDVGDGAAGLGELAEREVVVETIARYRELASYVLRNRAQLQPQIDAVKARLESFRSAPTLRDRVSMTAEDVDRAFARLRGVTRLMTSQMLGSRMSDRRAAVSVKRKLDGAVMDVVVLPARQMLAGVAEPTPEEMNAHFNTYRDARTELSENGIGYFLPARAKFEWMTLDKGAIRAALKLDPVEVNKHYLQNRSAFPGEFSSEKPKVEEQLMNERLAKILGETRRVIKASVDRSLRDFELVGGTRVLPGDWSEKRPAMADLAREVVDRVKQSMGVEIPVPIVVTKAAKFLTPAEIQGIPGVGSAVVRLGTLRLPVSEAVLLVPELKPEREIGVQRLVPFTGAPVEDNAGNEYYFTVLDAVGPSPAQNIDEVRERVVEDLKTLRAYDALVARREDLFERAATQGLEAASKEGVPGKAPEVRKGVQVTREARNRDMPEIESPAFVDAAFQIAQSLDPLVALGPESLRARTVAVPVRKQLSLALGQVTSLTPLTTEVMRGLSDQAVMSLARDEVKDAGGGDAAANPYNFKALSERWGFEYVNKVASEDEDAKPAAAKP